MTNNPYAPVQQPNYDPRWFVWTIVFLIVTGVSLVTYIIASDSTANEISPPVTVHRRIK